MAIQPRLKARINALKRSSDRAGCFYFKKLDCFVDDGHPMKEASMYNIFYLIGVIVVVLALISFIA